MSDLKDVRGQRVAVGAEGSGSRALADLLLMEAGVGPDAYIPVPKAGAEAAKALVAGEADVALIVSESSPPWIKELLGTPGVKLMPMRRAPALSRRHVFLDSVTLHAGVLDLAADLPAEDVPLVATAAEIVVREDLHPAIQSLLIEAAYAEHSRGSTFSGPDTFPTPNLADIPLSEEATRYYKNGPTFLRRIFPFDVANLFERAWMLAIPLATLAYPLVRAAPPVYRWRIRRKIYIWYRDLRDLEAQGRHAESPEVIDNVRGRLAELQAETGRLDVPLSYSDDLYRLRAHIRFVADLVDGLAQGKAPLPRAAVG